ncbi:MAG: hypothetical protein ACPGJS_05760 [Flammeovirgaceae bacterium]
MLSDEQKEQIESEMASCDGVEHDGNFDRRQRVELYNQVEDFFKTSAYTLTTAKRGFNISIECIQLISVEMVEFKEELDKHQFAVKLLGEDYTFKMSFCSSERVKSTFLKKIKRLNSLDGRGKKELHLNILGSSMFRSLIPGFTVLAISKKSSEPIQLHIEDLSPNKSLITIFAHLENKP